MHAIGHGPDLLLLHGSGAPAASLQPLAQLLSQTHRVWLPDMPGYQANILAPHQPTPQLVAALRDELLAAGVAEISVVGHSFGAYRTLHFASLASPLRVRALIALSPIASLPDEGREQLAALVGALMQGVDLSGALVQRWYSPDYAAQHPQLADQLRDWTTRIHVHTLAAELMEPFDGGATSALIPALTAPLHIRVGELDQAAPPVVADAIFAQAPRGSLTRVKHVGHMLAEEDTQATYAWLQAVLAHA